MKTINEILDALEKASVALDELDHRNDHLAALVTETQSSIGELLMQIESYRAEILNPN